VFAFAEVSMLRPASPLGFLRFCALATVVAATLVTATGDAAEPPVVLGEVSAPEGELTAPLRRVLAAGIASAAFVRSRERFVLSARLVRLDAERVGKGARATASVSLALRRAREQSLHAVLNGHATAEELDGTLTETREDALRAAVSSALRRLPEAVR
jgi:hypothetical protein